MGDIRPRLNQIEAIQEIQDLVKRLSAIDAQISHGADWHAMSERIKRWQDDAQAVIESYLKPKEQDKLDRAVRNVFSAGGITTESLHTYLDTLLETLSRKPESVLAQKDEDFDTEIETPEPHGAAEPRTETPVREPPLVAGSHHQIVVAPEPPVATESHEDALIPKHPVAADSYERPAIPEPPVAPDADERTSFPEPSAIADSDEETAIPERRVLADRLIPKTRRVLIIHSHDESNMQALAGLLGDRYSLKPVTIRREREKGKALIEKFEQAAASSSFAFVLMTPDDEVSGGKSQNAQVGPNALFELGWVCGRMGRDRVCIVSKRGTKIPPDLNGIDRIEFIESVEETVLKLERVLQASDLVAKRSKR